MLGIARFVVPLTLLLQATAAENHATSPMGEEFQPQPVRTGKERLGPKSSDEQRVDNCNVPLELRGSKPRPNDCSRDVNTRSKH
jgi:hypothetical protein